MRATVFSTRHPWLSLTLFAAAYAFVLVLVVAPPRTAALPDLSVQSALTATLR